MYSVGLITLAFSAARIHAVLNDNLSTKEWLLSQFSFVTWGTIEAFTAIICVNIPCIVAGFNKWHYRTSSTSSKIHRQFFTHAQDPRRHSLSLTKSVASQLYEYELRSSSPIQSTAFYDGVMHDGKGSNSSCIKVTQEFRADIELSRHFSNEDLSIASQPRPSDSG